MAPLSSSESYQSRFSSGLCSNSMASSPASGFGFDVPANLQRLVPSSASSNGDAAVQIHQQVKQYYLQRRHQSSQNALSSPSIESHRISNETKTMVAELPHQDPHFGRALQSYMQENMSEGVASSLMRYNSAPSSMLASVTAMGNTIMNPDPEHGKFVSNNDLHLESKKPANASDEPYFFESRGAAGTASGAPVDHLVNHRSGILSSYGPYPPRASENNNGEHSRMGVDVEGAPLTRAIDGLPELGPSSYHLKGAFTPNSAHLENGNGNVQGVPGSKNGLLRHSSSPAGFLSQLSDDHERLMLGSSSGNSSEEGSYEGQGGQGFLGNLLWDDAGNSMIGSPNAHLAVRKRIRDLEEKGYSQTEDGLEPGVLGNYFRVPAATSPDNAYFMEKVSPDSIPCRTRAKRGCATHPRSIAERVRRSKISERMKKLQELVPNMDKQTNTAEMLDEAVKYVRHLQCQVQELKESRSKCECSCNIPKDTSSN